MVNNFPKDFKYKGVNDFGKWFIYFLRATGCRNFRGVDVNARIKELEEMNQFIYGAKVRVIEGFYRGCIGTLYKEYGFEGHKCVQWQVILNNFQIVVLLKDEIELYNGVS